MLSGLPTSPFVFRYVSKKVKICFYFMCKYFRTELPAQRFQTSNYVNRQQHSRASNGRRLQQSDLIISLYEWLIDNLSCCRNNHSISSLFE